jgi:hypothetical protein
VRRRLYLRPSLNAPDQSPTCQFNDPDQCLSGEYSGKSFNYQERLSGSRDAGLIGNGCGDQELAKLELHTLKAVNGQDSVVNVFGEPG